MARHYVAVLDTGGISYSGREIVGIGRTPNEARAAVAQRLLGGEPFIITYYGGELRTVDDVADYYGIRIYGPLSDTQAVE